MPLPERHSLGKVGEDQNNAMKCPTPLQFNLFGAAKAS